MKTLHVNIRLSEGGAAGVARTLCDEQVRLGHSVRFAYGYGPNGGTSTLGTAYPVTRLTSKTEAAVNMATHLTLGHEPNRLLTCDYGSLAEAAEEADLVHLHVVHSYFLSFQRLVRLLVKAGKPVVWTLHDHWALTGRCAQPKHCEVWRKGCLRCPDLAAYPPARIDLAGHNFKARRRLINELQQGVPTSIVACAQWLAAEAASDGFDEVQVVRNSVDDAFWSASQAALADSESAGRSGFLFVCRDLRDRQKVDWDLLRTIRDSISDRFTVMGDNAPHDLQGFNQLPATNDRIVLARTMAEHRTLVFLSEVDYYPLTIAEALVSGMQVLAISSPASREFANHPAVTLASSPEELSTLAKQLDQDAPDLAIASDQFHPRTMAANYETIYRSLGVG